MLSGIAIHYKFEGVWPCAADYTIQRWSREGTGLTQRAQTLYPRPLGELFDPAEARQFSRLLVLGTPTTEACVKAFPNLKEIGFNHSTPEQCEYRKKKWRHSSHPTI